MIADDFEPLEYEEFVRRGKIQMEGLLEKYNLFKNPKYLVDYRDVVNILRYGEKFKDYCVFGVTHGEERLVMFENSSKQKAKEVNMDIRKERMFNFV